MIDLMKAVEESDVIRLQSNLLLTNQKYSINSRNTKTLNSMISLSKLKRLNFSTKYFYSFSILVLMLFSTKSHASHLTGGSVEYECIGLRTWKIRLTIYRNCTGAKLCESMACTQSMTARPNITLNANECSATPSQVDVTLNLIKVEDVDKGNVDVCGNVAKNGCNNLGQVTPGLITPSVEKYVFEGTLNLNLPSLNNTNCNYWDIFWTFCCRNAGIWNLAGSSGQDFRIGATIDIFKSTTSAPNNSSPILRNEPIMKLCSGQEYVLNMDAVDPDGDLLTYEIAPSNQSGGNPVNYLTPGNARYPFPLDTTKSPHNDYPFDNGPYIVIDSMTGDIRFSPLNNTTGYLTGNLNLIVKQWYYDNGGNRILLGITQRDIQFYTFNCQNNNLPKLITTPSNQNNKPITQYNVYAGDSVGFIITAKDIDAYPVTQQHDTTYINWSETSLNTNKLTIKPNYIVDSVNLRPIEDSWLFSWKTEDRDTSDKPYCFRVSARDNFCPEVGRTNLAFNINVLPNNAPYIKSFNPIEGKNNDTITITGGYFSNTTSVSFGQVHAKSYVVISPQIIRAVVDSGASGAIVVSTPRGNASSNGFIYLKPQIPSPVITSFTPQTGSNGTVITINGSNLNNSSAVLFGGVNAKNFNVVSASVITATVDTGATGNVSVVTPNGTALLTGFTYINNTGVAEYITQSYSIFPNPVSSEIIIESDKTLNNTSFELMDVNGKVLMSTTCNHSTNQFNIDVKTLSPAVYFLRITSQGQTSTVKVVKQ